MNQCKLPEEPHYAGVKFIEQAELRSLINHGFCAFVLSKEQRECDGHPEIGDVVHFLLDNSDKGRKCAGRLVADQPLPDGGCISIYSVAVLIYPAEKNIRLD